MFLGYARGSVGDVTMYRANGQQIQRARNRKPRNPRTNPQLYSRAIFATISKAYAAGKQIFDHSFEGFGKGAACQRQFLKLNADKLREVIASDINNDIPAVSQNGRVVAPNINYPVDNSYIVSRGSYPQNLFNYNPSQRYFELAGWTTGVKVNEYAAARGLKAGDMYTFVAFVIWEDVAYVLPSQPLNLLSSQFQSEFRWLRMKVKEGLDSDTTELDKFSQLFDFTTDGKDYMFTPANKTILQNFLIGDFGRPGAPSAIGAGAFGVIRSRVDQDLRSDTELVVIPNNVAQSNHGIMSDYILDVWQAGTSKIGNSSLILEGGDI